MNQYKTTFRSKSVVAKKHVVRNKRSHCGGDRLVPLRTGTHNPYNRFHYGGIAYPDGVEVDILKQHPRDFVQREYMRRLQRIWSLPNLEDRVFSFNYERFPSRSKKTKPWLVTPRRQPETPKPREALDLPDFQGDFYYNQMDWGPNDCVAAWLTGSVHIWNANDSTTYKLKTFEADCICTAVRFDTSGELLAIGTSKSQVEFWSVTHCKMYDVMSCFCKSNGGCSINSVDWHPTKPFFISGCSNGFVCTMHTGDEEHHSNNVYKLQEGAIALMRSSLNGTHMALCGDTSLRVLTWNDLSLADVLDLPVEFPTRALAWHPWQATLLAVGSMLGIIVYDTSRGTIVASWNASIKCTISALSFSLLTGELVMSIWLLEGETPCRRNLVLSSLDDVSDWLIRGGEDLGETITIMWSSDGRYIAMASSDEALLIWDFLGERNSKRQHSPKNKQRSIFDHILNSSPYLFSIR